MWGETLGAALGNIGAYQGYAAVADPHGSLLSWTTIEKGGIIVNGAGHRFGDESARLFRLYAERDGAGRPRVSRSSTKRFSTLRQPRRNSSSSQTMAASRRQTRQRRWQKLPA